VLLDRYGTHAESLIRALADDPDDAPLSTLPDYSTAELAYLAGDEDVVHLDDLLLRRTSIAFTGAATEASVAEIADVVAETMGWDAAARSTEVARALQRVHAADPSWGSAATAIA
jgi:glycerol-3-phosphate dehydrogenase